LRRDTDCERVLNYLFRRPSLFTGPELIRVNPSNICLVSGMGGAAIAAKLAQRTMTMAGGTKMVIGLRKRDVIKKLPPHLCCEV
jgi:hypothetical protein